MYIRYFLPIVKLPLRVVLIYPVRRLLNKFYSLTDWVTQWLHGLEALYLLVKWQLNSQNLPVASSSIIWTISLSLCRETFNAAGKVSGAFYYREYGALSTNSLFQSHLTKANTQVRWFRHKILIFICKMDVHSRLLSNTVIVCSNLLILWIWFWRDDLSCPSVKLVLCFNSVCQPLLIL